MSKALAMVKIGFCSVSAHVRSGRHYTGVINAAKVHAPATFTIPTVPTGVIHLVE